MNVESPHIFTKAGLAYIKDGCILLCKTNSFPELIMPGGSIETGESAEEALTREITEELGATAVLKKDSVQFLGTFHDRAAGKTFRLVTILLFQGEVCGELYPDNEVVDLVWWPIANDSDELSAIVRNRILPFLRKRL